MPEAAGRRRRQKQGVPKEVLSRASRSLAHVQSISPGAPPAAAISACTRQPGRRSVTAGSRAAVRAPPEGAPSASRTFKLGITTDEIDDDVLTAAKFLPTVYNLPLGGDLAISGAPTATAQPMEKIREGGKIPDDHGILTLHRRHGIFQGSRRPILRRGEKKLDAQWARLTTPWSAPRPSAPIRSACSRSCSASEETKNEKRLLAAWELTREAARRAKELPARRREHWRRLLFPPALSPRCSSKDVKEDNIGLTWDPEQCR